MPHYYPFLGKSKDKIKSLGIKLSEIEENPKYLSALDSAVADVRNPNANLTGQESEEEIFLIASTLSKILLGLLGDPKISEEYAKRKSEAYSAKLMEEELAYLIKVAKDELGMDIRTKDRLEVGVLDFLRYRDDLPYMSLIGSAASDSGEELNLVNGYVGIDKTRLVTLIKNRVKEEILESIPYKKDFPKIFHERVKELKGINLSGVEPRKELPRLSRVDSGALPPCIREIISLLESGRANHNAHFVLGTFLVGLNLDENAILGIFKRSPKFDEAIVRYQIEFMRDKGYKCPSCDSIKKMGLCKHSCKRAHPISNYFSNLRSRRRNSIVVEEGSGIVENG